MRNLQHIDLCIGESLEKLVESIKNIKNSNNIINSNEIIKNLGNATCLIWEARDILYSEHPSLKRDFKEEVDSNPQRYEELEKIYQKALMLEENNDLEKAIKLYHKLLDDSKYGYFKLLSEAGIYRCYNVDNQKNKI